MAATPSTMLPLGTAAPAFALPSAGGDHVGKTITLDSFAGKKALVVMFLCNHCPFVKHVRSEVASLARDYQPKGVGIIAISSNDIENYPDDRPELMAKEAQIAGYSFPYCYDASQSVAKAYKAACTPDFYLFDGQQKLVYRGQLDDSRPTKYAAGKEIPVNGKDLRAAIDAVLAGKPVSADQKPSLGCNIKWKVGNEPQY